MCLFQNRNTEHFSAFCMFKCQHRNTYLLHSIQVYLMSKIRNYFRNVYCLHSVSCCKCNSYLIQQKTELLDIVIPMSTNCEIIPTAFINNGILFRAHSINLILQVHLDSQQITIPKFSVDFFRQLKQYFIYIVNRQSDEETV